MIDKVIADGLAEQMMNKNGALYLTDNDLSEHAKGKAIEDINAMDFRDKYPIRSFFMATCIVFERGNKLKIIKNRDSGNVGVFVRVPETTNGE